MSGALLSVLCLVLGAAIWLVAYAPRKAAALRRRLTLAGTLAAPCLILGCLGIAAAQGRFGEVRLTLERVTAEVRQFPLTLGGDPQADDIVVARMAPSVAAILADPRDPSTAAPLMLQIAGSDATPAQALLGVRHGRSLGFPAAQPFAEGDAVCVVSPCEGKGAAWAILRGRTLVPAIWRGGRVVPTSGPAGPAMPQRKTLLVFGGINDWTPAQAVHPLRDYFPHAVSTPASGVMGDCDRWLCTGRRGDKAPVRSVLFQKGGLRGAAWSVVLADPGARIARADGTVLPFAAPAPIPLGKGLAVDLFDIRYVDAPQDQPDARRGQLQLRRSLVLSEQNGQARIAFATPPTQVLPRDGGASVPALGGRAAQAVEGALPALQPADRAHLSHAAFEAPKDGSDRLRAAGFTLDRLSAPWPMAAIAVLWAATVLLCCGDLFARRPALWAIFAVLQLLLALRFLFGLSGAAADPALDWRAILGEAAVAYVTVPAALLAWARWDTPRRPGEWRLDLAAPAVAVCVLLWTGGLGVLSVLLLAAWLLAAARRYAGENTLRRLPRLKPEAALPAFAGVTMVLVVLAARLAAGGLGWKERIDLGVMVLAISAIYTPLLIVGFSRMLAADQAAPRSWLRPMVFYALLLAATLILPVSVRDSGYALMFAPIAGMAAWGAWSNRKVLGGSTAAAALWVAPALMVLALLVALPVAGAVTTAKADRLGLTAQLDGGLTDAQALEVLQQQARASQNVLRLYLLGAPEELAASGSAEAESLKVWSAELADYTGSLWGRGYLSAPNLGALRAVQNTDNLTAVQLMSPFGRLAAGLLLALLMVLPVACAAMTRAPGPSDWRRICGFMALWCVFGAAAYMTLANLQLVPFTGRNAYLLASTSGGDLLEGAVLFFLAAWGASARGKA